MDKELLFKSWAGLIFLTGIAWIIVHLYNPTFSGVFVVFHILVLVLGFGFSLFGIKKKIGFSKYLLIVSLAFLIITIIGIFTCGFVSCPILS